MAMGNVVTLSLATRSPRRGSNLGGRSPNARGAYASGPGANLRRIRRAQNLSVVALADMARLSPAAIASVEAGADPALEVLWALAFALDVPFVELVKEAAPNNS